MISEPVFLIAFRRTVVDEPSRRGTVSDPVMSPRVLLLLFFEFSVSKSDPGPFKILKEWPKAIYDTKCLKNPGQVYYRSTKNRISGIKIFRNKIYLSVPREEDGVPVTLGLVSLHAGESSGDRKQ